MLWEEEQDWREPDVIWWRVWPTESSGVSIKGGVVVLEARCTAQHRERGRPYEVRVKGKTLGGASQSPPCYVTSGESLTLSGPQLGIQPNPGLTGLL